ncbi:MAG TPA: DUF2336 domain-containing protein [Rhizomicrobium sp.]|nr:DUF2336 domain-containing protein [Rhizomicrobium sp.]
MAASDKLSHLLQLADRGPALRAALAEDVAELLTEWQPDYPESMRTICEALLAEAVRNVDAPTRTRLRVRLYNHPELAQRVLPRESKTQNLIEAARNGENLSAILAESLGVDGAKVREILDDRTGSALAVACKGAHFDRATFSALVLLIHSAPDRRRAFAVLDSFDTVPMSEATRLLRGWREGQAA